MFKHALLSIWVLAAGAACAQTYSPGGQGRTGGGPSGGYGGGSSYTSMSGHTSYGTSSVSRGGSSYTSMSGHTSSGTSSGYGGGTVRAGNNTGIRDVRSASYSDRAYYGNTGRYAEASVVTRADLSAKRTPAWVTADQLRTWRERGDAYTVLENKYGLSDLSGILDLYDGKVQKGYVAYTTEDEVNPSAKGAGLFKNPFGPPGLSTSGGTCSDDNTKNKRFLPLCDEQYELTGIHGRYGSFRSRYLSYFRSYVNNACARLFINRIDAAMDTDQKRLLLKEYYDCLRSTGFNRFGDLSR